MKLFGSLILCASLVLAASADTEPEPTRRLVKCEGHTNFATSVAVSPDGRIVVSGGDDEALRFWNSTDGKAIRVVAVRRGWAGGLAFAPDGKTFAARSSENGVQLYNAATGKPKEGVAIQASGISTAFSADGKTLAVASDKGVSVLDVTTGKMLQDFTFDRRIGRVWRVAFSPDGKHLAAALHSFGGRVKGGRGKEGPLARVWELATGKMVFSTWHDAHVNAVAFSPDGKLLAIGGETQGTQNVEVHEWAKNKRVTQFKADKHVVFCLAFSADGKTLYTGGNDPEVKLWEPTTGKSVGKLEGHTDQVADISLSKDGKVLATAGRDKRVLIWRLNAKGR